MNRLLSFVFPPFFLAGYFSSQMLLDRRPPENRMTILAVIVTAAILFYGVGWLWLKAHDTIFGLDKALWMIAPPAVFLVGFVCFVAIR